MLKRLFFCVLMLWWPLAAMCDGLPVDDLAVLNDPAGIETVASVNSAEADSHFRPLANGLNAGYTRDVHWLRFTVQVPIPGEWWLEVQPSFLDDIRLYEPVSAYSGAPVTFREHRGGDLLPSAAREIQARTFVARLTLPDTQPRTFYLRVKTTSASMTFLRLWLPGDFQQSVGVEHLLLGVFYGLMLAVLIINLIYWIWLREVLYGYFCLHVLAVVLMYFGVNGFVGQYLFPTRPAIADLWVGFFMFLSFSMAAPFFQHVLRVTRSQPWLFRLYRLQLILPLLLLPFMFVGYFTEAARVLMAMAFVLLGIGFWRAYVIWRQGGQDGLFLLSALAISLLGAMPVTLYILGVLPGDMWMIHSRQITIFGSILAMHIAVATRMRDLDTSHREVLIRVRQAEARVEQETLAKNEHRQFIAMLSHELRTPLAVIDGAAQSLEHLQPPQDDETSLRYKRIRRSVNRINGLVKQFLTNDRIDDPRRMSVRHVLLDAFVIVQQAVQSCAEGATERVQMNAPHHITFRGDQALVQVALSNLLDNALKYSPPDSTVEITVEILPVQGQQGVAWTVADHGAGIALPERESVFGKYVRGTDHVYVAGTGLGLYLVQRIAEMHGGYVTILDREGWGAVFQLWLPLDGGEVCSG